MLVVFNQSYLLVVWKLLSMSWGQHSPGRSHHAQHYHFFALTEKMDRIQKEIRWGRSKQIWTAFNTALSCQCQAYTFVLKKFSPFILLSDYLSGNSTLKLCTWSWGGARGGGGAGAPYDFRWKKLLYFLLVSSEVSHVYWWQWDNDPPPPPPLSDIFTFSGLVQHRGILQPPPQPNTLALPLLEVIHWILHIL